MPNTSVRPGGKQEQQQTELQAVEELFDKQQHSTSGRRKRAATPQIFGIIPAMMP